MRRPIGARRSGHRVVGWANQRRVAPCPRVARTWVRRAMRAFAHLTGLISQLPLELRFALLAEGRDALLVVVGQPQLLISVAFDLEPDADAGLVRRREHPLDGLEREWRLRR